MIKGPNLCCTYNFSREQGKLTKATCYKQNKCQQIDKSVIPSVECLYIQYNISHCWCKRNLNMKQLEKDKEE